MERYLVTRADGSTYTTNVPVVNTGPGTTVTKVPSDYKNAWDDELKASNIAWNRGPNGRFETLKNTGVDIGPNPNAAAIKASYSGGAYSSMNSAYTSAAAQGIGQGSTIDSLASLLSQLAGSSISRMSFEEAERRAGSELNPLYQTASNKLSQTLNADMEQRGIYNSPLASGIMTEKQGSLSNDQTAAIAERANQLIQNDQTLSLQEKQMQLSSMNTLLSSLIGREANLTDTALREGEMMGVYNGQQTLSGKLFDLQTATQRLNNTINAVDALGQVTTQEQANLLGVPVGTPSWQAKNAIDARRQELQMFNTEMSYKQASLALQNQARAAEDLMANFKNDMIIWESTGVAPDTAAFRSYGINPGTPWTLEASQRKLSEAEAQIGLIQAEDEIQFQSRATNFMSMYGVTRSVAEVALIVADQSNSLSEAQKIINAQKSVLTQEGINIPSLTEALKKYYSTQTVFGSGTQTSSQSNYNDTLEALMRLFNGSIE